MHKICARVGLPLAAGTSYPLAPKTQDPVFPRRPSFIQKVVPYYAFIIIIDDAYYKLFLPQTSTITLRL